MTMKWQDKGGTEFEQAPVGAHVARCIKVIDIGTHESEYQGRPTIRRQCILVFELPSELMTHGDSAGKPFIVSKFYTASLSEKATLRHDLVCWRGKEFTPEELEGFDSKNVLDKCCVLSIIHNDQGKSRISGVMGLPKGVKAADVPPRVNELVSFSLDEFDQAVFDKLSDGYCKLIMDSKEFQRRTAEEQQLRTDAEEQQKPGYETDEVPF